MPSRGGGGKYPSRRREPTRRTNESPRCDHSAGSQLHQSRHQVGCLPCFSLAERLGTGHGIQRSRSLLLLLLLLLLLPAP